MKTWPVDSHNQSLRDTSIYSKPWHDSGKVGVPFSLGWRACRHVR